MDDKNAPGKPQISDFSARNQVAAAYKDGWWLMRVQTTDGPKEFLARTLTACVSEFHQYEEQHGWRVAE